MSTNRLEAFSDGVIAIAITLLVLDIKVPEPHEGVSLAHRLGDMWPNYAAYVVSFLTIGVVWINHHALVRRLRETDHGFLVLNLLLLLSIGVLPFTTALLAAYVGEPGEHLAAFVYASSLQVMAVLFLATNRHALARPHLLREGIGPGERRAILARNAAGQVPYLVAMLLAPVSSVATLVLCGAVAGFYALPRTTAI